MDAPPEILHVGALTLRRYRADDAAAVTEAVLESGAGLSHYETWAHAGYTVADGREYVGYWAEAWASGAAYYFAVLEGPTYLGSCGLSGISREHATGGLGFSVRSSATGRGVATAAAAAVAQFGFDHIGLHRIELMIAIDNSASRRVAEKVGAIAEGTLRSRLTLGGVPTDAVMYAIVGDRV